MSQLLRYNQPIVPHQRIARSSYSLLPVLSEGDVAGSSVAAVERPFCLAMADYEDAGNWHRGGVWAEGWDERRSGGETGVVVGCCD